VIDKIKNMNKKEKSLLITLIVLVVGVLSFSIYIVITNDKDDNSNNEGINDNNNEVSDNNNKDDNSLNFTLNNDEEKIINDILGDWGMCVSLSHYCYGIEIIKDENNTYQYRSYEPWSQYADRNAKILSGFEVLSENKYEITLYYPETSSDSNYGKISEKKEKANIDLSKISSNIIIINDKDYEKITTTRDEFYLSKIIVEDSDYVYDNKINLSEINEKELKRIKKNY